MTLNQGYSYRRVLGRSAAEHTVLSYLASEFSHSTETEWRMRIAAGEVVLDDRSVDGSEPLRAGSVLVWHRTGWVEEDTPQHYELVYQDEHLLAVDKPSGLPTIPGGGYYLNTLLSLVRSEFPVARPLHRLGRATSGLVLFAFSRESASILLGQWQSVHKQYQALGSFVASQDCYEILVPIGKHRHPRLGTVHAASPTGKPARSVARTLQRRSDSTVFEVDLHTGRPHQIRIHLAAIGHPLVGDPLYAVGGQPKTLNPGLPGDAGYYLHARRLKFTHPITGETLDLRAPLPEILRSDGAS